MIHLFKSSFVTCQTWQPASIQAWQHWNTRLIHELKEEKLDPISLFWVLLCHDISRLWAYQLYNLTPCSTADRQSCQPAFKTNEKRQNALELLTRHLWNKIKDNAFTSATVNSRTVGWLTTSTFRTFGGQTNCCWASDSSIDYQCLRVARGRGGEQDKEIWKHNTMQHSGCQLLISLIATSKYFEAHIKRVNNLVSTQTLG